MNKFGVFCFAIVVLAVHYAQASPLVNGPDAVEYQNYVNCVQEVQNKCENSGAPFQVLVQGPSGNRFVRSLELADGSAAEFGEVDPKHVSTFSIYQPKHLVKRDIEADIAEAVAGTLPADAATIGEQTRPADPLSAVTPAAVAGAAAADADKKDGDEKVGLALPVGLGLGLAGLRARTALLPLGIGARVLANPISPLSPLNPVTGIPVAARLAALRARVAALPLGLGAGIL